MRTTCMWLYRPASHWRHYMVLYPHSNNCSNNIIQFFGHAFIFFTSKRVKSYWQWHWTSLFAISSPITLWRCKWALKERVHSRLHHHPKTCKRHCNKNLILLLRATSLPDISLKLEKPASDVARTTTSAGLPSVTLNFDLRPWPTKMI